MKRHPDNDPLDDAPLLRGIPKMDPFVVPEGFFDRFPMQVQAAIARDHQQSAWTRLTSARWLRPALAGAVGVAMLAAFVLFHRPATPTAATYADGVAWYPDEVLGDADLLAELQTTAGSPGVQHDLDLDELTAYLVDHNDLSLNLISELQ